MRIVERDNSTMKNSLHYVLKGFTEINSKKKTCGSFEACKNHLKITNKLNFLKTKALYKEKFIDLNST